MTILDVDVKEVLVVDATIWIVDITTYWISNIHSEDWILDIVLQYMISNMDLPSTFTYVHGA